MKALEGLIYRNPKVTASLLSVLVLLLIVYGFIYNKPEFFQRFGINNPLTKHSTATISQDSKDIKVHFEIIDKDKTKALEILQKMGGSQFEDISLEVDSDTQNSMSQYLPITLNLDFEPNDIKFEGAEQGILTSSLPQQEYTLATGSASFYFKRADQIEMKVKDPAVVVDYATRSGQLQVSAKLSPLLSILSKMDTIEVKTSNDKISGEILLK